MAVWAPLVPYIKERTGLDDRQMGMMLLCLGLGSVVSMPITGALATRWGTRIIITIGTIVAAVGLPILATSANVPVLVTVLLLLGAALGAVDVAANIHAVEVERRSKLSLMSNFHGWYSVGGLMGSLIATVLLVSRLTPTTTTLITSVMIFVLAFVFLPGLLQTRATERTAFFVKPRGVIMFIGLLTFIIFQVEGSILDWSGILLTEVQELPTKYGGVGYVLFSLSMTICRLTGHHVVRRLGETRILILGSLVTAAGVVAISAPPAPYSIAGYLLIGLGAANLVPVLFSAVGRQTIMPANQAIAAVSTLGYMGILLGPAGIGFIAKELGLVTAFYLLAGLMVLVASVAWRIVPGGNGSSD